MPKYLVNTYIVNSCYKKKFEIFFDFDSSAGFYIISWVFGKVYIQNQTITQKRARGLGV